jgi:hypothetical protein
MLGEENECAVKAVWKTSPRGGIVTFRVGELQLQLAAD